MRGVKGWPDARIKKILSVSMNQAMIFSSMDVLFLISGPEFKRDSPHPGSLVARVVVEILCDWFQVGEGGSIALVHITQTGNFVTFHNHW